MSGRELDQRLVSAVRTGDADAVRALLDEGADPNAVDADGGLPVLCAAVATYDDPVAEALMDGGADPDRELPDGSTPLWRALESGSPAVFTTVLGKEPLLRLPEQERERLLTRARSWYETGAVEELRRRTGARGPAVPVRVTDGEYDWVDRYALGGLVVRAGHGAILTCLEWSFRILTPVDELIGRAVVVPDEAHVDWSGACFILLERHCQETWSATLTHRDHPEPAHRHFVADYLRTRGIIENDSPFVEREREFLICWAAEEPDSAVLAEVLEALVEYRHPCLEATGLRHAGHRDPHVRRRSAAVLASSGARSPETGAALLALLGDPHAAVRLEACRAGLEDDTLLAPAAVELIHLVAGPYDDLRYTAAGALASSRDRTPAVADALATLLDESAQLVRLEAAYGLALRDDPRTGEAIERVGTLDSGFEYDHRARALWDWLDEGSRPGRLQGFDAGRDRSGSCDPTW
ncbi:HEAT repeat domain-containing protein [Streptomyces sp. AC512_CC834]|uniref:HEAT repeat domain-containing protein n=1 Tax=Streptomyces sp. AC512_CC834 TaxID=2823691 RepID=UPI001C2812C1|nr:HEAT repeat domain-containing protein [Streptomyces sp. AC512_CC834]